MTRNISREADKIRKRLRNSSAMYNLVNIGIDKAPWWVITDCDGRLVVGGETPTEAYYDQAIIKENAVTGEGGLRGS